jgi:phosphatidylserine decarboxylase
MCNSFHVLAQNDICWGGYDNSLTWHFFKTLSYPLFISAVAIKLSIQSFKLISCTLRILIKENVANMQVMFIRYGKFGNVR